MLARGVHRGERNQLRIEFAYFLNEGLASLVVLTTDGRSVEVAIVGREGMVGTPLAVDLHRGPYRSIMQISGSGVRIKAEVLEQRIPDTPELRLVLSRYVLVQGQSNLAPAIVMSAMLAVGATGLVLDVVLRLAEARIRRRWVMGD